MTKFTIKQIFIDNCDKFILKNPQLNIRPIAFKEVEGMINCGNLKLSYALYYCEHCNQFMHVPFRCKSGFCNTCGVKYAQDIAFNISRKIIRCKHRHKDMKITKGSKKLFMYLNLSKNLLYTFLMNTSKLFVIMVFMQKT